MFLLFFEDHLGFMCICLFGYGFRFFKECPHPDDKQRKELSRELSLEPLQVKFWFQNKRTQMKVFLLYSIYILRPILIINSIIFIYRSRIFKRVIYIFFRIIK